MSEKNEFIFLQLTPARLEEALEKASTLGAIRAMQLCGVSARDMYTRAELSKKFGRGKVNRLLADGKLIPHVLDGGRKQYKLSDVLTLIN